MFRRKRRASILALETEKKEMVQKMTNLLPDEVLSPSPVASPKNKKGGKEGKAENSPPASPRWSATQKTEPMRPPPPPVIEDAAEDPAADVRDEFRAECDALFRRIDKDGDGRLTKKEIKSGLAAIQAQTGLIRSAKEVWKAADADGSKSVDRAEFFEFMSSHQVKTGSTDGHSAEVANAAEAAAASSTAILLQESLRAAAEHVASEVKSPIEDVPLPLFSTAFAPPPVVRPDAQYTAASDTLSPNVKHSRTLTWLNEQYTATPVDGEEQDETTEPLFASSQPQTTDEADQDTGSDMADNTPSRRVQVIHHSRLHQWRGEGFCSNAFFGFSSAVCHPIEYSAR